MKKKLIPQQEVLKEFGVDKKQWRKERPLATGVLAYFPDALLEVAHTSWVGNSQHNFGEPLHWAREKSTDQLDAALRHITDHLKGNVMDDDGCYHLSKAAWRILAELQLHIEKDSLWVDGKYIGKE
jgi:hypothetical protein